MVKKVGVKCSFVKRRKGKMRFRKVFMLKNICSKGIQTCNIKIDR